MFEIQVADLKLKIVSAGFLLTLFISTEVESTYLILALVILGLITCLIFWYDFGIEEELDLDYRSLMVLIVISGFLLRIFGLGDTSLWNDEAITANAAISLLEDGVPAFPSGYEYWRALPHTILVSISVFVFGVSDFAVRLPSSIIGVLTILLTYKTGKEFFDREIGLIAATLIAFTSWQIAWSRQVRMYALLQFLYLAAILIIYKIEIKKDIKKIVLLISIISISMLVHVTGYILIFIVLFYFLVSSNIDISEKISIIISTSIIAVLISELFYFSYPSLINRMVFSPGNIFIYLSWLTRELTTLFLLSIPGILLIFKNNLKLGILNIIAVLPAFYIYSFHVEKAMYRYLYFMIPFLALWSAFTLKKISKILSLSRIGREGFLAVILILLVLANFSSLDYRHGDPSHHTDYKSAYNYVEENSDKEDILVTGWTPKAVYYYRAPEYSIPGSENVMELLETDGYNKYSGAEFINSSEELDEIIDQNAEGWIVMSESAYNNQKDNTRKTLSSLDQVSEHENIGVWKWG